MILKLMKLKESIIPPKYATEDSSGMDVYSPIDFIIGSETFLLLCGFSVGIPSGYELQVRPRSGLSLKTSLRIANAPGTIDADYTGEVGIIFDNIGEGPILVKQGERVAQLVLCPVFKATWDIVDSLDKTSRVGGFGSTGV